MHEHYQYPPPASVEQVQHAPDGGLLHLWQDEDWLHGGKEQVSQETRLTGEEGRMDRDWNGKESILSSAEKDKVS